MDLVTQITLGAAVGEAALGRKIGNRALLWGGFGGLLPDLDMIQNPFLDPVDLLLAHRGISHSIFFAALVSPLLAWGVARLHRRLPASFRDWWKLFFWSIFTHPILDAFTVYGTGLFEPFSDLRPAFNTISIVDPVYTLPLLFAVILVSRIKDNPLRRNKIIYGALILSLSYIMLTAFNKLYIMDVFEASLAKRGVQSRRLLTNPAFGNNLLWYGIAEVEAGYYFGYYSHLDRTRDVDFYFIPRQEKDVDLTLVKDPFLLSRLKILKQFSRGYYRLSRQGNRIIFNDLRFGMLNKKGGDFYIFSWDIHRLSGRPFQFAGLGLLGELISRIRGI